MSTCLRAFRKRCRIKSMEYYCIMVKNGGEGTFKKDFEKNLSKLAVLEADKSQKAALLSTKIFFFKKKMLNSQKKEFEQPLFPGYCFLSTESFHPKIAEAAKKTKNFYFFLDNNKDIKRLQGNDRETLSNLLKFGEVQNISKARFDKNQKIVVSEGPLTGFEGSIVKVNRKRGRATVQIQLCSNQMKFDMAFEEITASVEDELPPKS